MERDLTSGSVLGAIARFSLPYLLSYLLQTLYGMADLFIIGRYNGIESTTAVALGSQVMHMLTVVIVGLAMGATVVVAKAVGGKKYREAAAAIGNTVTLFIGVSVVLTVALVALVGPIVSAMSTPQEAVAGTTAYLTVCFIGVPFITAYNVLSAVLRGMGDSKSPMYFIALACVVNIGLDFLFIGGLGLGPMGAALGTTLAQTVSVAAALLVIRRRKTEITLRRTDLRPRRETLGRLLKIGVPIAVQDGFIQVAFLLITVIANRRGLDDAAAVGIVEKIIGVIFLMPSTMLSTVSDLAAQDLGAGKPRRARQTLWYAVAITFSVGVVISLAVQLCAQPLVALFSKEESARVVALGGQYLKSYIWDCAIAGVHFCFSGYFCAWGRSGLSFAHNFISIVCVRIPGAYLLSRRFPETLFPMGLAAPAGSLLSAALCLGGYLWLRRKERAGTLQAE